MYLQNVWLWKAKNVALSYLVSEQSPFLCKHTLPHMDLDTMQMLESGNTQNKLYSKCYSKQRKNPQFSVYSYINTVLPVLSCYPLVPLTPLWYD